SPRSPRSDRRVSERYPSFLPASFGARAESRVVRDGPAGPEPQVSATAARLAGAVQRHQGGRRARLGSRRRQPGRYGLGDRITLGDELPRGPQVTWDDLTWPEHG